MCIGSRPDGRAGAADDLCPDHLLPSSCCVSLEHLSLTIWDTATDLASTRLRSIQELLDRLNAFAVPSVLVPRRPLVDSHGAGARDRHLEPTSPSPIGSPGRSRHPSGLGCIRPAPNWPEAIFAQLQIRARRPIGRLTIPRRSPSRAIPTPWTGAARSRTWCPAGRMRSRARNPTKDQTRSGGRDPARRVGGSSYCSRLDLLTPCTMLESSSSSAETTVTRDTPAGAAHRRSSSATRAHRSMGRIVEGRRCGVRPGAMRLFTLRHRLRIRVGHPGQHGAGDAGRPAVVWPRSRGHLRQPGRP